MTKNHKNKTILEVNTGKVNRRRFIGKSALAGASLSFLSCQDLIDAVTPDTPPNIPSASNNIDTIIIGSGFGGAVAAHRLTEAGHDVMLFERGKRWETNGTSRIYSKSLPFDKRSTWLNDRAAFPYGPPLPTQRYIGVLEANRFENITVMAGAGYGGGSLVYGGLLVQPPKEIFDLVFSNTIDYNDLDTNYYPVVRSLMNASKMPSDIREHPNWRYIKVNEEQDTKAGLESEEVTLGYDWDRIRASLNGDRIRSAVIGESLFGNSCGSKTQLDTTYLRLAQQTGKLEVKTQHIVRDIGQNENGSYWVYTEEISEFGYTVGKATYNCNKLFVAAGSIGTSKLFVKAKAKGYLSELNDETGKGWGNNGNTIIMRDAVGVDTGRIQASPSSIAVKDYNNPITPLYIEHTQFPLGFECRCLNNFGIGIHPNRGRFVYDEFNDDAKLLWGRNYNALVNQALMQRIQLLNNTNKGGISTILGNPPKDDTCFHPLGGMVLGKACDVYGRVKNYSNLYVIDGAMMPGLSACANPALTIAALAERNVERILTDDF